MVSAVRSAPHRVEAIRKSLEHYRPIVGDELIAEIRDRAHDLSGLRVLQLSATATGGGVAEMLASLVPLEQDVGLCAEWQVITADAPFFEVTKKIHNAIQGMTVEICEEEMDEYRSHNAATAEALEDEWDVIVVHDPQPAAVRSLARERGAKWVWRCHIDSSAPYDPVWQFLRPFVERHDHAVFTMDDFIPGDLRVETSTQTPAIDPLTSKNRHLPAYLARETVAELGVDLTRPLLLQVSRFDPWKDPLGVVDVWEALRETFPNLQLALIGAMASDDPEGWRVYGEIEERVRGERDCFLLSNQMGVTGHEVNAFQRVADVVIQKSVREGFGLIVSETLWKGTAIVAGRAGGIPLQLEDGVSGLLADGTEEFASSVRSLLEEPVEAQAMGAAGAVRVRERFLLPRLLLDELDLLRSLARGS
jgi:trehalose synthase